MPAAPSLLIVPYRSKTGKLYSQIPTSGAGDFTVTRDTTATRFNSAGLIASVASGIPRLDYYTSGGTAGCPALLVEPAATNLALHSRDLSNAVWSGTNVTRAKNAVGADGVASGATTLTATAASGTVLQALSHASQSRVFSAYVRRVTGTGAIEMTTNGGTNWTTVTISSLYTQVACAAQTVASGTVGFRMAVSGDVIEVDFTQGEVGPVATSPIPTTTGSVTRNADVVSVSGAVSGSVGQTEGTIYLDLTVLSKGSSSVRWLQIFGASNNIGLAMNSSNQFRSIVNAQSDTLLTAPLISSGVKVAWAYDGTGTTCFINGTQYTLTNGGNQTMSSLTSLTISGSDNPQLANARIRAVALYTTRLTNAELAALTTP
jgi:hypothetical protein